MHNIDMKLIEMTLDVMKYAIYRITNTSLELGSPKKMTNSEGWKARPLPV